MLISSAKGCVPDEKGRRVFLLTIVLLVALEIFLGFTREQIDNGAHVGGLLGGLWVSYGILKLRSPSAAVRNRGLGVVSGFVLVFFVATLTALFPVWRAEYLERAVYRDQAEMN